MERLNLIPYIPLPRPMIWSIAEQEIDANAGHLLMAFPSSWRGEEMGVRTSASRTVATMDMFELPLSQHANCREVQNRPMPRRSHLSSADLSSSSPPESASAGWSHQQPTAYRGMDIYNCHRLPENPLSSVHPLAPAVCRPLKNARVTATVSGVQVDLWMRPWSLPLGPRLFEILQFQNVGTMTAPSPNFRAPNFLQF